MSQEEVPGLWPEARISLDPEYLKRCSLCGALNAAYNEECFNCRGVLFSNSEAEIKAALAELLKSFPELAETPPNPVDFLEN